jgi:hypothetical protein
MITEIDGLDKTSFIMIFLVLRSESIFLLSASVRWQIRIDLVSLKHHLEWNCQLHGYEESQA